MKRLFVISILFLSVWITTKAYDFKIDGLAYEIESDGSVCVTHTTSQPPTKDYHSSYSGDIVIPSTITYSNKTYNVTGIGSCAFKYCTGVTSVTIPNSITSIWWDAFLGCTGLTSITIPNSVTSIDSNTFQDCTGLTSITIPSSVTKIGSNAFRECTGLTSITIPSSVTTIALCAFQGCTGLTSITIPSSVTTIGSDAFRDCKGLNSIVVPYSVVYIGTGAFQGCKQLFMKSTTLPKTNSTSGYVVTDCTIYAYRSVLSDFKYSSRWNSNNTFLPLDFEVSFGGTMNKDYVVIKSPEKVKLSVILPSGYTQDDIVWSSDNSEIAEVDSNGTVTGIKPGFTVVHAKEEISNLDAKAVVVVDGVVLADSISLDKSVYSIHVGESASAKATVMPALTLNKDVRWASMDSTIVSIDSISGQFTGMKVGTTLIKATTNDGTKLCSKALVTVVDTEGYDFTKPATLTPSIEVPEEEDSYISFKEMNLAKEETSLTVGLGDRTGTSCRMYTDENLNYYLKAYAGATITIAGKEKNAITKVMFNGETIDLSANGTTLANGTWQGNAKSITFTVNSVNHINSVKVEFTPISNVTINDDFGDENGVTELKGDMNDDGNLDMSDVTTLISKVLDN